MNQNSGELSHPKYRTDIDGLRAVAVLGVVAFHAFPGRLSGGFIGVDIFFVISGFLITTIIVDNLEQDTFSLRTFYARRIRRIFPALIVTMFGVMILGWSLMISEELKKLSRDVFSGAFFLTNFTLQSDAGYFHDSSETNPLLHLWSLAIEEQFYLVWPLFLILAWKRKLNLLTTTLLLILLSFYLNVSSTDTERVTNFYSPQSRFWELLVGSLLAMHLKSTSFLTFKLRIDFWLKKVFYRTHFKSDGNVVDDLTSFFGATLLTIGFLVLDKSDRYPGFLALIPVFGSALIIYSGKDSFINRRILSLRIFVWFGLISYPLYLLHWPLISYAWIVNANAPSTLTRLILILVSIGLAWLTMKYVERPFRFSRQKLRQKVSILCLVLSSLGLLGGLSFQYNLTSDRGFEDVLLERKGKELAFGSSLKWYEGKQNWLYLGNNYEESVAKLKLTRYPTKADIQATTDLFNYLAKNASVYGTKLALIVGPNKESVYPEYLPSELNPSLTKYSEFFLSDLKSIPNLIVYNPTDDLVKLKPSQGLLYWKTDTHWNSKGAYLSFKGFLNLFSIPAPPVKFVNGSPHRGDLLDLAEIQSYPLESIDDWKPIWDDRAEWSQKILPAGEGTFLNEVELVVNQKPLSNKVIWVIGDSFTNSMKEYFNSTFKNVVYLGHWAERLEGLPIDLENSREKPDMVVIVRVERSF